MLTTVVHGKFFLYSSATTPVFRCYNTNGSFEVCGSPQVNRTEGMATKTANTTESGTNLTSTVQNQTGTVTDQHAQPALPVPQYYCYTLIQHLGQQAGKTGKTELTSYGCASDQAHNTQDLCDIHKNQLNQYFQVNLGYILLW